MGRTHGRRVQVATRIKYSIVKAKMHIHSTTWNVSSSSWSALTFSSVSMMNMTDEMKMSSCMKSDMNLAPLELSGSSKKMKTVLPGSPGAA